MGPLSIILGCPLSDRESGKIRLVTPSGEVVSIHEKDIVHEGNADGGGDLKRYAIHSHATVFLEFKADIFCAPRHGPGYPGAKLYDHTNPILDPPGTNPPWLDMPG